MSGNNKFRPGVENIPLRQINTKCPIIVFVIDLRNNDEILAEYRLDYANFEDRKHLGRITYHAVSNHLSVETMSIEDAEPDTIGDIK